jgi:hypothetical protein
MWRAFVGRPIVPSEGCVACFGDFGFVCGWPWLAPVQIGLALMWR